ncbi:RagB/SusD family nutrient uptake outer membrane protein [Bacteroides sp. 224]|uniref:RagB/SusD family nutrient uptake outer membrane protein n=1 Tax=Bacteroides sp. 224 TaxID=2302936 RepID=UPI0013D8D4F6|nr:RagB/SusD family nutrient uptake outer membrane protein [Bacteroides sp. 224]NDV66906.1 RagB/SusD family nutrient uptake outer membrane protein [Bacteroides sp. 224]
MKKIYLLATAFSFATLTGCSDFLDQDLKSNVPGAEYYETTAGFESLANAAYSSLRTIYGGDPWLFEGGTDLFASGRNSVNPSALYGSAFTSANDAVTTFYTDHYKAISLANEVIYWGGSDESRALRVAEARGLRALYYLNLVQQFGGVPLIKERTATPISEASRASTIDTYNYIIGELSSLAASSALPNQATDGRFNKRAANHYLAKAYLSKGYISNNDDDFRAALSAAQAAGAGQALTTPFATLFSNAGEGNEEILFYVEYDAKTVDKNTDGNKQQAHFCAYLDGQEKGHKYTSSTLTPTLRMHELFNTNTNNASQDERYEGTFMTELRQSYWHYYDEDKKNTSPVTYYYCPSWELANIDTWRSEYPSRANAQVVEMTAEGTNINNIVTSYYSKMREDVYGVASFRKFDDIGNGKEIFSTTSSMKDIYLARLGETNLIAAEACIKLKDQPGALSYIKIVRDRAKATTATQSEMTIDYILNERARELAGEYHRWADLARTGKLAEYVEAYNPDEINAGQITKKFYLRPIPLSAIELNSALQDDQNEGWE